MTSEIRKRPQVSSAVKPCTSRKKAVEAAQDPEPGFLRDLLRDGGVSDKHAGKADHASVVAIDQLDKCRLFTSAEGRDELRFVTAAMPSVMRCPAYGTRAHNRY